MKRNKYGVKLWQHSDAKSVYVYDTDVCAGKDTEANTSVGTLNERVVRRLIATPKEATVAFDRFFTTVYLIDTLSIAAVATCNIGRRNMPQFSTQLQKGEYEFLLNHSGTLALPWMDTKNVLVIINLPHIGHNCYCTQTERWNQTRSHLSTSHCHVQ